MKLEIINFHRKNSHFWSDKGLKGESDMLNQKMESFEIRFIFIFFSFTVVTKSRKYITVVQVVYAFI